MNKVVLVTGASSGIGMGAALKFIDEGFTVYAAARRTELMAEISKKGGKVIKLDLCDSASIKDCVESIKEKEGRIDVLVNNAGFGLGGSIEDLPMEEVRKQFDVNVFGLGELTQKSSSSDEESEKRKNHKYLVHGRKIFFTIFRLVSCDKIQR